MSATQRWSGSAAERLETPRQAGCSYTLPLLPEFALLPVMPKSCPPILAHRNAALISD